MWTMEQFINVMMDQIKIRPLLILKDGYGVNIGDTVSMESTTTDCTGDCAGQGIFTATGSHIIDNSKGSSKYRVYVYLDGFRSYNISIDTAAIYNCEKYTHYFIFSQNINSFRATDTSTARNPPSKSTNWATTTHITPAKSTTAVTTTRITPAKSTTAAISSTRITPAKSTTAATTTRITPAKSTTAANTTRIAPAKSTTVATTTTTQCTVTVTNESGHFLCGTRTNLKCAINPYRGGMTWKLDGTIISQCAFGDCNPLGALPAGDVFTYDETTGTFYLDIGITHSNNGTMYQCDDGSDQDQITVDIKVPPRSITVTVMDNALSVTAGCFYPSTKGRMEVYCVIDGENEVKIGDTVLLKPTSTGCTGDCAGPGIFTATGRHTIDSSIGSSKYRVYVYLDGFRSYSISVETAAIYNCEKYTQ
ncbi:hypothetical protein ACF0H5_024129 [Mactra antiquata]